MSIQYLRLHHQKNACDVADILIQEGCTPFKLVVHHIFSHESSVGQLAIIVELVRTLLQTFSYELNLILDFLCAHVYLQHHGPNPQPSAQIKLLQTHVI